MSRPVKIIVALVVALISMLSFAACSNQDPLRSSDNGPSSDHIVIGSQDYYSNEIIAEIYAQTLESHGFAVERKYRIGQREAYISEIEKGTIDVFPEYTGNLLQYWSRDTTAREQKDVYAELEQVLPEGLEVLPEAQATDQDVYAVEAQFAEANHLQSIGDLAQIKSLVLGGNSELETRPYGTQGLRDVYGVDVSFTPIEDSGGPLTLKALHDGDVQLVKLNSADPAILSEGLVVLDDPAHMLLASHVVPLVQSDLSQEAKNALSAIQDQLDEEDLLSFNAQSITEQKSSAEIAREWLAAHNV